MATFNNGATAATATSSSNIAANFISSSINAAAVAEHFQRSSATFLVPSSTTHSPLQVDAFVNQQQQQQHNQQQQQQQSTSATSSYTFLQIKREPCQVSEVTTSNNGQQQQQQSAISSSSHLQNSLNHHTQNNTQISGVSKTMSSSSTLTTLVKIEASSPKVTDMDKVSGVSTAISTSTNNSVPIGIAVARKRPQESTVSSLNTVSNALPVQQQNLNKDLNCFGIRVADLGGVSTGCGNIYFTGNGDLMTGPSAAEELALTAAGMQSVNRAPSTFWQYPNALPIESVISMSPATVGLQYSREASRGQVVLLPATPALDPFQQAAAAFVWPSYLPQGTTSSTLQPPPNFLFPSMSPHPTLQSQPYATSLQVLGSNYLTAAAAAAAAAAATSTLCQHNQQSNNNTNGSINLSLGSAASSTLNNSSSSAGIITANSCTTSSSRFLSVASAAAAAAAASSATTVTSAASTFVDTQKHMTKHQITTTTLPMPSLPPPLHLPAPPLPANLSTSLFLPPTAMKIEEWSGTSDFMSAAAAKSTTTLAAHHFAHTSLPPPALPPPPPTAPLNFELRDKQSANSTTTLDLHANATQALNLMRLPTPPTSANVENAAMAAQLPTQLLFQTNASPVPTLLNLSASLPRSSGGNFLNTTTTTTLSATIGPPTPMSDDNVLNFKTTGNTTTTAIDQHSIVVGVPRVSTAESTNLHGNLPQMQDVNIQTDTPVCSEDESANEAQLYAQQDMDSQEPLELTKHVQLQAQTECHNTRQQQEQQQQQQQPQAQQEEQQQQQQAEQPAQSQTTETFAEQDMTGLELLSNISASKLVKSAMTTTIRVKQEPMDVQDYNQSTPAPQQQTAAKLETANTRNDAETAATATDYLLPQTTVQHEPLGALDLLCALAEQRIQEEVQSGGSGGVFATPTPTESNLAEFNSNQPTTTTDDLQCLSNLTKSNISSLNNFSAVKSPAAEQLDVDNTAIAGVLKRKKHKHSKTLSKKLLKAERKKNKKKKKKHALLNEEHSLMEYDEQQQLQEELKSTLSSLEPNLKQLGKWPLPNPQELLNIMENDMRLRLADITRQYRKRKRKLDEIKKSGKKKKGAKHAQQQQQQQQNLGSALSTPTLSLCNTGLGLVGADYKFPKITTSSNAATYPQLNSSNFMRFNTEKTQNSPLHMQFPPLEVRQAEDNSALSNYKSLRLEPSTLAAAEQNRSCAALRLSRKHNSADKSLATSKDYKISINNNNNNNNNNNICTSSSLTPSRLQSPAVFEDQSEVATTTTSSVTATTTAVTTNSCNKTTTGFNRELTLTNEHLYRKETRVLTDMGGLFYAGILKPLQPPDVYAITLDGERGNKSHIMSREEVLKDTIIEMAPKSVESVPVGTRLCAYWSQQYRCLYPGRAIESESSDEDSSAPRDYVSVEFDDGDSGRIRLQNIRLLLSDYPQAEYNDNPLYSLGKNKKSTVKSTETSVISSTGNKHMLQQSALGASTIYTQQSSLLRSSTLPGNLGVAGDEQRLESSLKLSGKELLSKEHRIEKKRLKNLKKKAAAAAVANGLTASPTVVDDSTRKHRKHKKRKKHKKHHKKNNNNNNNNNNNVNGKKCDLNNVLRMSKHIVNMEIAEGEDVNMEQEQEEDDEDTKMQTHSQIAENEEEEEDEEEGETSEDVDMPAYKYKTALTSTKSNIKMERNREENVTPLSLVKVKQENLFVEEEETTSNLMSETSDETKADDEVEHKNSKGSKIAAFLPDRQLWGWLGTAYRKAGVKGRARKQFYKTIKRGKETISVGDSAVFLSTGRPDRPYIGRIESMWETTTSNKIVRVRWFYHPEETTGCPELKYPGALFESPHEDENDVQTISHRCEVLPFSRYFMKFGADSKQYQSIYDNNDTYYLAGYYNPKLTILKLEDDIPMNHDNEHNITITTTAITAATATATATIKTANKCNTSKTNSNNTTTKTNNFTNI